MNAEDFVARLNKCRSKGANNWAACCPAHEDRSPSMSISARPDGRILVHCFAGCSVDSILGAMGLEIDALFPDSIEARPEKRSFSAAAVLECVAEETRIVFLIGCQLHRGVALSEVDRLRLGQAVNRIEEARRLANG